MNNDIHLFIYCLLSRQYNDFSFLKKCIKGGDSTEKAIK